MVQHTADDPLTPQHLKLPKLIKPLLICVTVNLEDRSVH